jgi:hypothetical protein
MNKQVAQEAELLYSTTDTSTGVLEATYNRDYYRATTESTSVATNRATVKL